MQRLRIIPRWCNRNTSIDIDHNENQTIGSWSLRGCQWPRATIQFPRRFTVQGNQTTGEENRWRRNMMHRRKSERGTEKTKTIPLGDMIKTRNSLLPSTIRALTWKQNNRGNPKIQLKTSGRDGRAREQHCMTTVIFSKSSTYWVNLRRRKAPITANMAEAIEAVVEEAEDWSPMRTSAQDNQATPLGPRAWSPQ